MLAVDDEAGLLAVLLGTHHSALNRAAQRGFERVALDPRQELGEEGLVHPVDALALRACRRDEVEEMHHRRRGLARVSHQRMVFDEPAHRDLLPVPLDLLGRDGAPLLRDVEQRLEEHAPRRPSSREPAWLVGSRKRIEQRFDRRDPPRVLARDVVDAP